MEKLRHVAKISATVPEPAEDVEAKLKPAVFKFYGLLDPVPAGGQISRFESNPVRCVSSRGSLPPGRPKIHHKIIKMSGSNLTAFFLDFGCHLASKLDKKSIPNRKKYVFKAASKKLLKNTHFKVENRCFQSRK